MTRLRAATPTIWGRDTELQALREHLDRAVEGIGIGLVIEGEGGIGKTRFIAAVTEQARDLGFEVYVASAEELERDRPMSAIARALRSFSKELGSPVQAVPTDDVLDRLERHALSRPLLLCIEDLHWADAGTLMFVRMAMRRADDMAMVVIATTRPAYEAPELARTIDRVVAEGVQVMPLGPLDPDDVAAVVRDVLGATPGPNLTEEVERASGNAFYVLELLSALAESGAVEYTDGIADTPERVLPPSLRVTILRRLVGLPQPTLEVLKTAAMLGSAFAMRDLATATGRDAIDLMTLLGPALGAGFLVERGDRLAFRHDLIRAALYEDLPETVRTAVHRQIGGAFAQAGYPPSAVAPHMALGATQGDDEAIEWLTRAADDVGWTELGIYEELLRQADALCSEGDPRRTGLRSRIVAVLAITQRGDEAVALAADVLAADPPGEVEFQTRYALAHALQRLSRIPEAAEQFEIARTSAYMDDDFRAAVAGDLGTIRFAQGQLDSARELATYAAGIEAKEYLHGPCAGHIVLSYVADAEGDIPSAVEHGLAASLWSDRVFKSKRGIPPGPIAASVALAAADRHIEALEHLHRGHRRSESAERGTGIYEQLITFVRYQLGEWDDATASSMKPLHEEEDIHSGAALLAFGARALIALHRGHLGATRRLVERAEELLAMGAVPIGADIVFTAKAALVETSDPQAGFEILADAWSRSTKIRYTAGTWRIAGPALLGYALAIGRTDVASEVALVAQTAATRAGGLGSVSAVAMRLSGLVTGDAEAVVAAATALRETGRQLEAADTARDAATLLAASGDGRSASLFAQALATYESLGAARAVDQTRAVMREHGIRAGTRGTRKRASTGWDALTDAERRVVELVKDGLTNAEIGDRLFISRRTVQTHLRNVFDKLQVSSRAEVAAEVIRRASS
jgi:DNA-binding CsgD family transcriptional regulator/tetratricopeptide (TPR) repeat protein